MTTTTWSGVGTAEGTSLDSNSSILSRGRVRLYRRAAGRPCCCRLEERRPGNRSENTDMCVSFLQPEHIRAIHARYQVVQRTSQRETGRGNSHGKKAAGAVS